MRPYGVWLLQYPDVADILTMGAKGSVGEFSGRSGQYHGLCRGPRKAKVRRYWKRVARAEGKRAATAMLEG
jgi:hypothetical protein